MSDELTHPDNENIRVSFERIGPSRAKEILASYDLTYRKYKPAYAEGLARDMQTGNFHFDGAPVRLDANYYLLDGQHRLSAVEMSETRQTFLVVSGLPTDTYDTMDTGIIRTLADSLRREGYQNAPARAALIRAIARWESGLTMGESRRFTMPELNEFHSLYNEEISRAIQQAFSTRSINMPFTLVAFCWWLFTKLDLEMATYFMVALAEGENIKKGMPAYTLREHLWKNRDEKYTSNEYLWKVFSAWNAYREGRELERVAPLPATITRNNLRVI